MLESAEAVVGGCLPGVGIRSVLSANICKSVVNPFKRLTSATWKIKLGAEVYVTKEKCQIRFQKETIKLPLSTSTAVHGKDEANLGSNQGNYNVSYG